MNASKRVFWLGLTVAVATMAGIYLATGTGWGAALVMGYLRAMLLPSPLSQARRSIGRQQGEAS